MAVFSRALSIIFTRVFLFLKLTRKCALYNIVFSLLKLLLLFSIMLFGVKMLLFSVSFNGAITSIEMIMVFRPVSW